MSKPQSTDRRDIYAEVTETIIAALEQGTVPWHRPWNAAETGLPVSISTGKPYRGVNVFLLMFSGQAKGYSSPWWGTFKAIQERGGSVRKGEKGTLVTFWKRLSVPTTAEEQATTKKDRKVIPMLKHYVVFNAEQADGLPEKFGLETFEPGEEWDPIGTCEEIAAGYTDGPTVSHNGGNRAFYRPMSDSVHMPTREAFESPDAYYSTLFHELTHSTGHESRLARKTLLESHAFGDTSYSKEELVAEMGAAMLSAVAGIHQTTVEQSAAYLAGWLRALRSDPKLIIQAGGAAQRAADRILGITFIDGAEDREQ